MDQEGTGSLRWNQIAKNERWVKKVIKKIFNGISRCCKKEENIKGILS
jgi:hypothetical protein